MGPSAVFDSGNLMDTDPGKLVFHNVTRQFDRAAANFDAADFVHRRAFDGIIERLAPVSLQPARILDLGCGTGTGSRQLAKVYRKARVISLDASANMLARARAGRRAFSGVRELRAEACRLPLQTGKVDLVVANLLLPWIDDLPQCFSEVARVLANGGVFAFATLGAGSLATLKEAWRGIDSFAHVREFADMHDLGDGLVRAGLADPVLDVDVLNIAYQNFDSFIADVKRTASRNSMAGRRPGLTGKASFFELEEALTVQTGEHSFSLQLELVFGHAFGTGPRPPAGEFHLPAAAIGRRRG